MRYLKKLFESAFDDDKVIRNIIDDSFCLFLDDNDFMDIKIDNIAIFGVENNIDRFALHNIEQAARLKQRWGIPYDGITQMDSTRSGLPIGKYSIYISTRTGGRYNSHQLSQAVNNLDRNLKLRNFNKNIYIFCASARPYLVIDKNYIKDLEAYINMNRPNLCLLLL